MSTPAAPVPQRLCPHCASVAVTAAPSCPWCGRSYRRASTLPVIVAVLLVQTVIVVGVMVYALSGTGNSVQSQVDAGVAQIQREIDARVREVQTAVRQDLRDELDRRLPAAP